MEKEDYTATFSVSQTPGQVFEAIKNVRKWWEGTITGSTDNIGDVFTYQYEDFHFSKQKITELVPDKKVAWLVIEGGPKFTNHKTEWKGTKIIFEISKKGNKTEVHFTHEGLIPRLECYDSCSDAWGSIIKGSLRTLITKENGRTS